MICRSLAEGERVQMGRRAFLRISAVGAGAGLLTLVLPNVVGATGVIVMDHRDCGAYKAVLGEDFSQDRAKETAIHMENLKELRRQVTGKYPALQVELLLMNLDGKVEVVA